MRKVAAAKKLDSQQTEATYRGLVAAVEFGFREHEKGNNLQATLENFRVFVLKEAGLLK